MQVDAVTHMLHGDGVDPDIKKETMEIWCSVHSSFCNYLKISIETLTSETHRTAIVNGKWIMWTSGSGSHVQKTSAQLQNDVIVNT